MITELKAREIVALIKKVGEYEAKKALGVTADSFSRYLRIIRNFYNIPFEDDPLDANVKILEFDIESAPSKAWTFRRWKVNISQDMIQSEGYLLCYAAKWLGDKDIIVDALPFYDGYTAGSEDDSAVVKSLHNLISKADIVIAHNAKGFDIPLFNTRALTHGLMPPKPYKIVDTLKVAKAQFKFPSNKLDSIGSYLGLGRKTEHEGFKLWVGCMDGVKEAWDKMIEYNEQDVSLLESVYLKLRPWDSMHPAMDVYSHSGVMRCKACGSTDLTEHDFVYTHVSAYTSHQCNSCGHWNRGRKNQRSREQMQNTLMNVAR
jgi:hypothetical protein